MFFKLSIFELLGSVVKTLLGIARLAVNFAFDLLLILWNLLYIVLAILWILVKILMGLFRLICFLGKKSPEQLAEEAEDKKIVSFDTDEGRTRVYGRNRKNHILYAFGVGSNLTVENYRREGDFLIINWKGGGFSKYNIDEHKLVLEGGGHR